MKCDRCDREATVHELRVDHGKKAEQHLCDACAKKAGIAVPSSQSVPELIQQMLSSPAIGGQGAVPSSESATGNSVTKGPAKAEPVQACPQCSMTYAEFRQGGQLGCPHCYVAFEGQLGPLLERWHEGGSHHVGKMPRRALRGNAGTGGTSAGPEAILGGAAERASRIAALQRQLSEAVQAEQYERAAALRDQIKQLSSLEGMGAGPSEATRDVGRSGPR